MPSLECFSWETLKVHCITLITDLLIAQQPPAYLHRLTAWGLTVWGPERAGITAIVLRGKSGYRQLGHNTLRLQVEAVSFSFILPGCHGDDGADLRVVPHWDVMCCVGDTYWYAGVPHNQGQVGLISSQKMPLNYTLPMPLKLGDPPGKHPKFTAPEMARRNLFLYLVFGTHTSQWWFLIFVPVPASGAKLRTQITLSSWQVVCIATIQNHTLL